jgi:cytochrome b6-f complex iron-sulfur subunit
MSEVGPGSPPTPPVPPPAPKPAAAPPATPPVAAAPKPAPAATGAAAPGAAAPAAAPATAPKPPAPAHGAPAAAKPAAPAAPGKPISPDALKPSPPVGTRGVAGKPGAKVADPKVVKRREFVWWSTAAFLGSSLLWFTKFMFPRALFEPRTKFRIGSKDDYGFGVNTKWQSQQRIWVCRNAEGLFVIYARCTHLGCTPDWKESENKFKCPCHGSGFDSEGINFEGPAPRPLERAKVSLDAEGQIVVDTSKLFNHTQWDREPKEWIV